MRRFIFQPGIITLLICALYCAVMIVVAPGFATPRNLANVLFAMLPLLIVAAGQTVVLINAGIDLSVTSTIALTSVAGAAVMTTEGGWLAGSPFATPLAILVMLVLGAGVGLINGICVAGLRMPPFIVTLTTMMFFSGFSIWWTQSESIGGLPQSFVSIGKSTWLPALVALVVATMLQVMLSYTWIGWGIRAVGSNAQTARVSGVHVPGVTVLAYIFCGLSAAVASILITGQLETGSPVHWENNMLDVIGATVIGGTSLFGGRGNILWTLGGVLLLSVIDNSLNLMNLSHFTIMMSKGGVILLAAMLDASRNRERAQ